MKNAPFFCPWKFMVLLVPFFVLSGCATKPLYPAFVEPDPVNTATARLRIVVSPATSSNVQINKDSTDGCLISDNARRLPVKEEKVIGIPYTSDYFRKAGTEMYIPSDAPLTLSSSYYNSRGNPTTTCTNAIRFTPETGKDYQLFIAVDTRASGSDVCSFEISEIKNDTNNKLILANTVSYESIAVPGSIAWNSRCKK